MFKLLNPLLSFFFFSFYSCDSRIFHLLTEALLCKSIFFLVEQIVMIFSLHTHSKQRDQKERVFLSFLHVFNAGNMKRESALRERASRKLCFARIQRKTCGVAVVAEASKEEKHENHAHVVYFFLAVIHSHTRALVSKNFDCVLLSSHPT